MQSPHSQFKTWLASQCQKLGGVKAAALVQVTGDQPQILAKWPSAESVPPTLGRLLMAGAQQAQKNQRLFLQQLAPNQYLLAQPILINGQLWGLVTLQLSVADKKSLTLVLQELKLGQCWLQFLLDLQSQGEPSPSSGGQVARPLEQLRADQTERLLHLSATLLKEKSIDELAISLVNSLATQLGAVRVSLGLLAGSKLQLQAVSYAAQVDARTHTMQSVSEAMQEALEQGLTISCSAGAEPEQAESGSISRAHQELLHAQQLQWVGSIPVRQADRLLGAITIELDKQSQLSVEQLQFIHTALQFAGAIIALRQDASASLTRVMARALNQRLHRYFGPGHWRGRIGIAAAVLLVLCLFIPLDYRISADAQLQTTEKYLVVAPQEGYLGQVLVRPGDAVSKGALLGTLNDEDLRLERRKLISQVQRYRQAYDSALAIADRVEAAIANAQVEQAEIQLRLIEQQLERTQLVAPMSGIVVSEDIAQNQGAPVQQGELLFELAAPDEFVVQLFVDERDIAQLAPGQEGQVKFSSLPNALFAVSVIAITPISEVKQGRNYFRVELALLDEPATASTRALLRPGMSGTGKVSLGSRALAWVLFHDLWHWLRLSLW